METALPAFVPVGTIMSLSDKRVVTFYGKDSEIIGEIDFSTEKIIFEGNMDSSAEVLFTFLRKILKPLYEEDKIGQ